MTNLDINEIINNNREGTTVTDNSILNEIHPSFTAVLTAYPSVGDKIVELIDQRESLKAQLEQVRLNVIEARERTAAAQQNLEGLKRSLQRDLAEFTENYLSAGDDDYNELSELMQSNGLDGLKRSFVVTVRVSYEFEVEVEAADEKSAQIEVDNDIVRHLNDHIEPAYPDEVDFEVSEA